MASSLQVSLVRQVLSLLLDSTQLLEDDDDYTPIKAAFMLFTGLDSMGLLQAFRGFAKFRTSGQ